MRALLVALLLTTQGCAIVRHEWDNGATKEKTTVIVPIGTKLKSVLRELERPRD